MKAWQFDYDVWDGECSIIYAETRNEAKAKVVDNANEYGDLIEYKDVMIKRVPWADKYGDYDNIPKKILLEHGFDVSCERCGYRAYEDECAEDKLPHIICKDCARSD